MTTHNSTDPGVNDGNLSPEANAIILKLLAKHLGSEEATTRAASDLKDLLLTPAVTMAASKGGPHHAELLVYLVKLGAGQAVHRCPAGIRRINATSRSDEEAFERMDELGIPAAFTRQPAPAPETSDNTNAGYRTLAKRAESRWYAQPLFGAMPLGRCTIAQVRANAASCASEAASHQLQADFRKAIADKAEANCRKKGKDPKRATIADLLSHTELNAIAVRFGISPKDAR